MKKIIKAILKSILAILCGACIVYLITYMFGSAQRSDPWGLSFTFNILTMVPISILLLVGMIRCIMSIVKDFKSSKQDNPNEGESLK